MSRSLILPRDQDNVVLAVDGREVRLTNLRKNLLAGARADQGRI